MEARALSGSATAREPCCPAGTVAEVPIAKLSDVLEAPGTSEVICTDSDCSVARQSERQVTSTANWLCSGVSVNTRMAVVCTTFCLVTNPPPDGEESLTGVKNC